jgi:hypothetical protein
MPVSSQKKSGNVFVLGGSDFVSYNDFFLLDFETVPSAWYFFFKLISFHYTIY